VETHLIVSRWARVTIEHETDYTFAAVRALADVSYSENDQAAAVSSGSFLTRGMVIAPCSTKTLAGIATGFAYNLVCRAADVVLKERRSLVLAVRETPLSSVHLRNMLTLSDLGATILPPTPAFYTRPEAIDDIVEYTVLRILDQFRFDLESPSRWKGLKEPEED
jgi:4-hydroxy-3-polyprenylbenzoate decarboxylase